MDEQRVSLHFQEKDPQRLDKYLVSRLSELSRTRIQALIKDGLVLVDGEPAHKAGQVLEKPVSVDVLIPPSRPSELVPEPVPLNVLFENQDLVVINKPAGMVVHPAAGHATGTLVHAVLAHSPDIAGVGGQERPGVVHRLDKETSGLILMAKNDRAHRWLQDQFRLRKVEKVYLALVDGHPPTPTGRIELAIGRSASQRNRMAVVDSRRGREAVSEYRTLEVFRDHTLLEVHPETGRTHQIRLHLQYLGCPVAGDTVYGRAHSSLPLKRHFLHACRLTIRLPGETKPRTFEAPLPPELEQTLADLRSR